MVCRMFARSFFSLALVLGVAISLATLPACSKEKEKAKPAAPSVPLSEADINAFMSEHFGDFDRDSNTWEGDYGFAGSTQESANDALSLDHLTRHSICAKHAITVGSEAHVLLAVCSAAGDDAVAGTEKGLTDFFELKKEGGKAQIVAALTGIASGALGQPNEVRVVSLGKDFYGFAQSGSAMYMERGCGGESLQVYAAHKNTFATLLDVVTQSQNGDYAEGGMTSGDMKFEIDRSQHDVTTYPVRLSGELRQESPTESSEGADKLLWRQSWTLKFDPQQWKYVLPPSFTPLTISC